MERVKRDLLRHLLDAREQGHKVAAYGAAAKGNSLLNYCGIKRDLIDFVVDRNPEKQGRFLPGSEIPVLVPQAVFDEKPDELLILPWNLKDEIMGSMAGIRDWGGKFVVPLPVLQVL